MKRPETRISLPRWRTLGGMALAVATVAIIGAATVTPAKADGDDWRYRRGWHEREWREHNWRERREDWRERHPTAGFYFYSPGPYGYYQYNYDR